MSILGATIETNCVYLKWIMLYASARLEPRSSTKEGSSKVEVNGEGAGSGRHAVWLGKGSWQSDWDRSSCREMQEKGRFSICLLCPSECEFRRNLDRSPEKCTGTTHLKYGIRAHLPGSVSRMLVSSSFPGPNLIGHQN